MYIVILNKLKMYLQFHGHFYKVKIRQVKSVGFHLSENIFCRRGLSWSWMIGWGNLGSFPAQDVDDHEKSFKTADAQLLYRHSR